MDWAGFGPARANLWHRQLHIFLYPFYYVEYAIAQLGALQVWANSKRHKAEALAQYQRGLALGNSRPLPELFAPAGCRFSFSRDTVRPLVRLLRDELAKPGEPRIDAECFMPLHDFPENRHAEAGLQQPDGQMSGMTLRKARRHRGDAPCACHRLE